MHFLALPLNFLWFTPNLWDTFNHPAVWFLKQITPMWTQCRNPGSVAEIELIKLYLLEYKKSKCTSKVHFTLSPWHPVLHVNMGTLLRCDWKRTTFQTLWRNTISLVSIYSISSIYWQYILISLYKATKRHLWLTCMLRARRVIALSWESTDGLTTSMELQEPIYIKNRGHLHAVFGKSPGWNALVEQKKIKE